MFVFVYGIVVHSYVHVSLYRFYNLFGKIEYDLAAAFARDKKAAVVKVDVFDI